MVAQGNAWDAVPVFSPKGWDNVAQGNALGMSRRCLAA